LASYSWPTILGWYIVTAIVTTFEPDPSGLGIEFHWTYVLQGHLLGLAIRLLLPLTLLPLRPTLDKGGLFRLSLGACVSWLWVSPIAWIWHTPVAGIVLTLVRELAWVSILLIGSGLQRPQAPVARRAAISAIALLGIVLSIALQSVPDLIQARGIRMDNVRSGRIVSGTPNLPTGIVIRARWVLHGPDDLLQPARLALGARQTILESAPGRLVIEVAPGNVPPPVDTAESRIPSASEGTLLDQILSGIPAQAPDSLKLLMLHDRVHSSIRYDRTYFPGNCDAILKRGTGDCKAFAHLMSEGARRLGLRAREVHGLLASPDGYYAHAWTTIELGGHWTDWDPTSNMPFPDARYLRFSIPERANGAFDGELGIFTLQAIEFQSLESTP